MIELAYLSYLKIDLYNYVKFRIILLRLQFVLILKFDEFPNRI